MRAAAMLVMAAFTANCGALHAKTTNYFMSGNKLLEGCDVPKQSYPLGICTGYSVAVMDAMLAGQAVNGYTACAPVGVTASQVRDVVIGYLKAHPEVRHYAAVGLVAEAIAEAFPCNK